MEKRKEKIKDVIITPTREEQLYETLQASDESSNDSSNNGFVILVSNQNPSPSAVVDEDASPERLQDMQKQSKQQQEGSPMKKLPSNWAAASPARTTAVSSSTNVHKNVNRNQKKTADTTTPSPQGQQHPVSNIFTSPVYLGDFFHDTASSDLEDETITKGPPALVTTQLPPVNSDSDDESLGEKENKAGKSPFPERSKNNVGLDYDPEVSMDTRRCIVAEERTMDSVLLSKQICGVSIREIFDFCWSEYPNVVAPHNRKTKAFYGPWLLLSGKNNVQVGIWKSVATSASVDAKLLRYQQQRTVSYSFQHQDAHEDLPLSDVKYTEQQYCRLEDNNRLSILTIASAEGLPFSESYQVHWLWTASRVGRKDLQVLVQMYVVFHPDMAKRAAAAKIKSMLHEEYKRSHIDLFRTMKKACLCKGFSMEDNDVPQKVGRVLSQQQNVVNTVLQQNQKALAVFFPFLSLQQKRQVQPKHEALIDTLQQSTRETRNKIRSIRGMALPTDDSSVAALDDCLAAVERTLDKASFRSRRLGQQFQPKRSEPKPASLVTNSESKDDNVQAETQVVDDGIDRAVESPIRVDRDDDISRQARRLSTTVVASVGQIVDQARRWSDASVLVRHVNETLRQILEKPTSPEVMRGAVDPPASVPSRDAILDKMQLLFGKELIDVSIDDLYDVCFSEGNHGSNEHPFYAPWLRSTGRTAVSVGEWQLADTDNEEELRGSWCQQLYTQRRVIAFEFETSKYEENGSATAPAEMIQYCRWDGTTRRNKWTLQSTVTVKGIPFCESFAVHVRWVVTKQGKNNLLVQVGTTVEFFESSNKLLAASMVERIALQDTRRLQLDLFRNVKMAVQDGVPIPKLFPNEEYAEANMWDKIRLHLDSVLLPKVQKLTQFYPGKLIVDSPDVAKKLCYMERQLDVVDELVARIRSNGPRGLALISGSDRDDVESILEQLHMAHESLDIIGTLESKHQEGLVTVASASFE